MNTPKDTDIREALRHKYANVPQMRTPLQFPRGEETKTRPLRRWWFPISAIAASIALLIAFHYNNKVEPETQQPVIVEVVELETPQTIAPSEEIEQPVVAQTKVTSHKSIKKKKQESENVIAANQMDSVPRLLNTADSLYYYLAKLENQMGECRDSVCLAELGNLMRADERIKGLVNKIIHKQVETAYQEEYLVDTTTRYIPL